MSLYPPGFVGVNLRDGPDSDPYAPGRTCPGCRGVDTFFHLDPPGRLELVCVDCLTGRFDSADPDPPLRARLIGTLPGTTVGVYEYVLDRPADFALPSPGPNSGTRPLPRS